MSKKARVAMSTSEHFIVWKISCSLRRHLYLVTVRGDRTRGARQRARNGPMLDLCNICFVQTTRIKVLAFGHLIPGIHWKAWSPNDVNVKTLASKRRATKTKLLICKPVIGTSDRLRLIDGRRKR